MARVELAPIEVWGRLFDVAGWPSTLERDSLTHRNILTSFASSALPDALLDALQCALDLGTPEGVDELHSVAESRGVSSSDLGAHTNPLTFVFELWLRHHDSRPVAAVLRLAQLAQHKRASPTKTFREFVGTVARPYPRGANVEGRVRSALDSVLSAARMGPILELLVDEGRTVSHALIYAGREQEHLVVTTRGRERSRMRFVACDVLQYDPRDGRLTISTRSRGLIAGYRRSLGEALFNDPDFFAGDALWSLDVLQRDGHRRLSEHGMRSEIAEVTPRRVAWRPDDENRVVFDGEGCFDLLGSHDWRSNGRLLELDLELRFWGVGANRARVAVKVPNRVEVRPERYRATVDRYLAATGIRAQESQQLDLWSVAEGVHGREEIAQGVGESFELLQVKGLVRVVDRRSRVDGEDSIHEEISTIQVHSVAEHVVVSDDHARPPEIVTVGETLGGRVEMAALTRQLSLGLSLAGEPRLAAPGLHDLGVREAHDQRVRVYLVARKPVDEAVARAAIEERRLDGSRPLLLVPTGRRVLAELPGLECSTWCPPFDSMWPRAVRLLGLDKNDPWAQANPAMELLIHQGERKIRFHGVDIELRGEQAFYFVLAIAQQERRKKLTTRQLAVAFTGDKNATPQAVSMMKKRVLKDFEKSLGKASRIFPEAKRLALFARRTAGGGGLEIRVPFEILGGPPSK